MNNKTKYISYLSVIGSIAVVYLHANGCFWSFSTDPYWKSANIIESLFYFAVPIFFMISGATLLNYSERYDTKTFFKKRAVKTLIPFLAWSIIALILIIIVSLIKGDALPSFREVIKGLVSGRIIDVYWFFPALFCVYLCIPLFAAVAKEKRKAVFSYIAVVCFVLNILIPFFIYVFDLPTADYPYYIGVGAGYLFYVLTGYLLNEYDLNAGTRVIIYILSVLGLLTHILGTYFSSMEANELIRTYKGYNNLPCILYTLGLFVLVKNLVQKKQSDKTTWLDKIVMFLKRYTFSIYLIHYFFIQGAVRLLHMDNTNLWYRLLCPIVVIVLCIGITFVLRKIPVIKKIVPE
ncbi:MAG: acyltransferase [Parasporobacterium sp.]|nr:acyltransferase [Parasporobacterium sp.]